MAAVVIIIELTRVSNFLSQLTVGKSAGAFILDRDGNVIAAPDSDADELNPLKTDHPLLPPAVEAMRQAGAAYDTANAQAFHTKVTHDDTAFAAVLTPISFPGCSLVTVIPESEFVGPVAMTIRKLLIGLAVLIVIAGALSAWLAQRLIAAPLIRVVGEIRHIERFDLDKVERHPSRLIEIGNLSSAIGDMAQGLAAFRKYIPADLVRRLIGETAGLRRVSEPRLPLEHQRSYSGQAELTRKHQAGRAGAHDDHVSVHHRPPPVPCFLASPRGPCTVDNTSISRPPVSVGSDLEPAIVPHGSRLKQAPSCVVLLSGEEGQAAAPSLDRPSPHEVRGLVVPATRRSPRNTALAERWVGLILPSACHVGSLVI